MNKEMFTIRNMARGRFSSKEKTVIGDRIRRLMQSASVTKADVARGCGITRATAGSWERGEYVPGPEHADNLKKVLRKSYNYIIFGKDSEVTDGFIAGVIEPKEGQTAIPLFNDFKSAVGGKVGHTEHIYLSDSFMRAEGVQSDECYFAPVRGSSMNPWIPDGTLVGVDKSDTAVIDGNLYSVEHGGLYQIRVLYEQPSFFRVVSYNAKEYPEEVIQKSDLSILGSVFTVLQMRRSFPSV